MKALGLAVLGLLAATFRAKAEEKQPLVPSITVTGSGKAAGKPDTAQVQMGVVTDAESAAKALDGNNEAMAKLFAALERRGIGRRDMQTSNFSVSPRYGRGPRGDEKPQLLGYQVSNMVSVKVRKLDDLGPLLDDLVQVGANQVHGVQFTVAQPAALQDEARRKAVADARRKAELYAAEASVEVGGVLLIQEQTPHLPGPPMMAMARGAASGVPVAEGEVEVNASITVTYALGGKGPPARGK